MSVIERILGAADPSTGAAGEYQNPPGNPGAKVKGAVESADQLRGTVIDFPIILLAVSYLYNKTFIEGTDESFTLGDLLVVVALSFTLKRYSIARRWQGVM